MAKKNTKNIEGELREYYIEQAMKYAFKLDFQTDLFSNIHFPELPKRFPLYMSEVEFPDKAKRNPNGSLFMDPLELNRLDTNDAAKQLFNSKLFSGGKVGLKNTLNPDAYAYESEVADYSFSLAEWFYYGIMMNQLYEDTASGVGPEIVTQDVKKRNESFIKVNTDVQKAITSYITRSISIITPLIELVRGSNAGSYTTNIKKAINTANRISANNVEAWLDANLDSQVLGSGKVANEVRELQEESETKRKATHFLMAISYNIKDTDKTYINEIAKEINRISKKSELDELVRKYTNRFDNFKDFESVWSNKDASKKKFNIVIPESIKKTTNESLKYNGMHLNESESSADLGINYDKIYFDLKTKLSAEMSDCIAPRSEWTFIKGIDEAMKKLKDKTSELVVKRIHHVCKTKESDRKSLITWPLKANGLIGEWERAATELDVRIKNRMEQFYNGESGVPEFVEQFLTETYPSIIAMMLTYRTAFEQMNMFLKNNYIPNYTLHDIDAIIDSKDEEYESEINAMIIAYETYKI